MTMTDTTTEMLALADRISAAKLDQLHSSWPTVLLRLSETGRELIVTALRASAGYYVEGQRDDGGRAVIEGDAVVVRFPLDAMQTAMDGAWSLRAIDTRYKITDINEFAKEFRNALNREDEQGTTEIHKMADRAFIDCIESGAFGIEEHEQQDI